MPNMPAKITRLELVIIVAALVVLVFSNRPPQPGNAETREDIGLTTQAVQDSAPQTQPDLSLPPDTAQPESIPMGNLGPQPSNDITPDNMTTASIPQPQPKTKRMAMVDARQCDSLRYPNVMYGEITVRWVWDGTRFVPRTVCEVKESNGVVSIWNFDDHYEGVVVTPIPADQVPAY